jgi:uncharacterized protein
MLTIAGFLTGLLVGLTGVGGGALMTPLLLLVFGVAPNFAVGTDLLFAAATKSVATRVHHAHGLVDWQVVTRLWCGSVPGAFCCLLWLHFIPGKASANLDFLRLTIAVAVILTVAGMVFQKRLHAVGERLRKTQADQFKKWQRPLTIAAGAVLGVLVTLTSIGAGTLGAVLLTYLYPLRLTPPRLIATDITHAIPLALFAGVGHLLMGNVNFELLFALLLGSVPGVLLGAMFSSRLPHHLLRVGLVLVLSLVGAKLFLSSMH